MSDNKCASPGCTAVDGKYHSVDCLFEHFLAYTGYWELSPSLREMLRKAYGDGHEAGAARLSPPVANPAQPELWPHPDGFAGGLTER